MGPLLLRTSITATLALVVCMAWGQRPEAPQRVVDDLCGCIERVDPQAPDRALGAAVRTCLENAVVHHPSEVLSLLERAPAQGSKAYRLGLVLGDVLQRDCPSFRAIQVRLQLMPPPALPTGKRGT